MNKFWAVALATLLVTAVAFGQASKAKRTTLEIYYVDVEGGAATLIVTPAGESILIDAGWPGFDGRDAKRIQAAMAQAGVVEIDHLIMTHYHVDHFGGIPQLAGRVKVNKFYDRGPTTTLTEDKDFVPKYAAYRAAAKEKTITLNAGDVIKLKQAAGTPPVSLQVLASRGEVAANKAMVGAGGAACASAQMKPEDTSDNARSVTVLLRYGAFDFLDSGDLTWNIEHKLVCPVNLIGEVDLYQVAHHGMNISNNPLLLSAIKPTVAIMNNGARKGGHPDTVKWLRELPSLKGLWQVHRNVTATAEQNAPADFIANLEEAGDEAKMITVVVDAKQRQFTVTNARNGKSETYPVK